MIQNEYELYLKNTYEAIMELVKLYHNIAFVTKKISKTEAELEGNTPFLPSMIAHIIETVRARYGYYCDISYLYNSNNTRLKIKVKAREYGGKPLEVEPEDVKLTDEETRAVADTFKEMFTNAAVAYKLDSRKKSIKYSCSECKGTFYMYDKYDYCPRCGKHIVGVEG